MVDRFFLDDLSSARLTGPEFHHFSHVMRIEAGEMVELVNGRGALARARVEQIGKDFAAFAILQKEHHDKPRPLLALGIPLMRTEKIEWVVEKGTELGADAFFLFAADYSEKKSLSEHQRERLRQIAISAMKQCGRLYLPEINFSTPALFLADRKILFGDLDPSAPRLSPSKEDSLFITGPEKGFSPSEEKLLRQKGAGVKLHINILRAETAPIAALSVLCQELS